MLERRLVTLAFLVLLLATVKAWATPQVLFNATDLGGGNFQYNLFLDNAGGSEPLSGLLVIRANSVFGVDASTPIGAPQGVGGNPAADWDFLAPVPFVTDILFYFSTISAADVPINGFLGGFSFQSSRSPGSLTDGDFEVEGIGANTANEIVLGIAQPISEPSTLPLFLVTVFLLARYGKIVAADASDAWPQVTGRERE